jgi:hypothetical protein
MSEVRLSAGDKYISANHILLFACAIIVWDRGQHVNAFVGDVNGSRYQIGFLKMGGTLGGDASGMAGRAPQPETAFELGHSWCILANFGEKCKPMLRTTTVCGVESGHDGGSGWQRGGATFACTYLTPPQSSTQHADLV